MPSYKNQFRAPDYAEQILEDETGNMLGTLRLKPSGVCWKPKGQQKFYTKSLDDFEQWIMDPATKARRTKS